MKSLLFCTLTLLVLSSTLYAQSTVKVSAMPTATAISSDDYVMIVDDPGGTATSKKITWSNIIANMGNINVGSITSTSVDGSNRIAVSNNTTRSPTAATHELYPEGNIWKVNQNGTERNMGQAAGSVPSTATDACEVGMFASDTSNFYVCVAQNTWRRASVSSW